MYNYFKEKYSYSKVDLIHEFGDDYKNFFNMMAERDLVEPNSDMDRLTMQELVDDFIREMTSNRKKRR